jgi:hypothetical protein
VFHLVLLESDGPIRVVVADGGGDEKGSRQLRVNDDFGAGVEVADEGTLVGGVGEDVAVDA